MREFEFNLSMEELEKRTHKDYLMTKKMLTPDAKEYTQLAQGDKDALKHLVKAAYILEKINMQLDCHENLEFKEFLEREISRQNLQKSFSMHKKVLMPLIRCQTLLTLQKGINHFRGKAFTLKICLWKNFMLS